MFIIVDLKIYSVRQNKVKVEVVKYGQCSETSSCRYFWKSYKSSELHCCNSEYFKWFMKCFYYLLHKNIFTLGNRYFCALSVDRLLGKCDSSFYNNYWQWNTFLFGASLGFPAYFFEATEWRRYISMQLTVFI